MATAVEVTPNNPGPHSKLGPILDFPSSYLEEVDIGILTGH